MGTRGYQPFAQCQLDLALLLEELLVLFLGIRGNVGDQGIPLQIVADLTNRSAAGIGTGLESFTCFAQICIEFDGLCVCVRQIPIDWRHARGQIGL